ncbi:extracellular solute-binding protein [Streptomyces sp. NPDC047917]|uniref:extracellular solute-binding protein n=1 Tax=Streptomyces sp. NPDC047917 TaxID=3365491 RepID=UPI0037143367
MNRSTSPGPSRRNLLRGAALGLAALGTGQALAGCSGSGAGTAVSTDIAKLPAYVPITEGPVPDLKGNGTVQPVYYRSPAESALFQSVTGRPGSGGKTSAFVVTYYSPPPAANSYLSYMGEQVNTTFDIQLVPGDSYASKFATMTAGGDLPDLVQFLTFAPPQGYPQLLDAKFQDLSEHLSGDKVRKYPNLANLPEASWASARVNGRIYGVPEPRPPFGSILVCRPDIIGELTGQEPAPKNEADFTALCKEVTDARANRYAICGQGGANGVEWGFDIIGAVFGVPNGWKLDGGRLVNKYETDEWIRTISYIKKLRAAGYYHPDTPSLENSQAKTYLANGTVLMHMDGISSLLDTTLPRGVVLGAVVPFGSDGGKGANYQGTSSFGFTAFRKADRKKIEEQLGILDYLAAPYGSQEYFKIRNGKEGVHFTRDGDDVELTRAGRTTVEPSGLFRVTEGPQVLTNPIRIDEQLRRSHAWQVATQDMLVENPVQGLYSPAASRSGSATSTLNDTVNSYILGRADLNAVRSAISSWKSAVGNTVRREYTQQLDRQGSRT